MNNELNLSSIIDDYLKGRLNSDEVAAFEQYRKNDASIDQKVIEQRAFLEVLTGYSADLTLKDKLSDAHAAIDVAALQEQYQPKQPLVVRLWRYNRSAIAVAASFLLLTSLSLYAIKFSSQQSGSYEAMRRELKNIKNSQNNLIRDINSNKIANNMANPGRYGGTGFAVTSNGYICTNYHVINGADSVYVQNSKGVSFKVRTVYRDSQYDLAILKIIDPEFDNLPGLPYGLKTKAIGLGEIVYTLGFPKDDAVLGEGYVSSKSGFSGDTTLTYQVSIPVNPGNSGGPLLDNNGNIIGVISGKESQADGAAFAIKSKYILDALRAIPQDSLTNRIASSKRTRLQGLKRTRQIEKIQDYVYMVRVYN